MRRRIWLPPPLLPRPLSACGASGSIQRLTWPVIRACATSDEEAFLVGEAVDAIGKALVLGRIALPPRNCATATTSPPAPGTRGT
ncbi:DUF7706 family protein [Cupriavidus consociatus]|uniref:DUF7706 family protein n=1 Tax=Cupriavidus consociatus TaxID=2821357 RepID=UPI003D73937C